MFHIDNLDCQQECNWFPNRDTRSGDMEKYKYITVLCTYKHEYTILLANLLHMVVSDSYTYVYSDIHAYTYT